jgi:hypothetical protein
VNHDDSWNIGSSEKVNKTRDNDENEGFHKVKKT